jgi:DNA-binding transcriptional MerR regulator
MNGHKTEPENNDCISIGVLAKNTGVTTRTLRYYEEMGIMSPSCRTEGSTRAYTLEDVRKLKFVLKLKELGLTIKEMQELDRVYAEARETNRIIPLLVEMLDHHIDTLDEKMSKLSSLRKEIVEYRKRMIEKFQLSERNTPNQ